jgi:hypothetical protein
VSIATLSQIPQRFIHTHMFWSAVTTANRQKLFSLCKKIRAGGALLL